MSKIDVDKYYQSLPKEQQDLITNVMLATMDMCSELLKENIIFPEYMAYRVFKLKMLSHMLEDEYFDFKLKYVISCTADKSFPIHTTNCIHTIAFHTKEQAKEFLSYSENIKLLKDYFMV